MLASELFYLLKPLIPRWVQIGLRRKIVLHKCLSCSHVWPIDPRSSNPPDQWTGWPEGKRFALVLTHDVDTAGGHQKCMELARLETAMGFRSSFNFVPERYAVSAELRRYLTEHGFEVGVHGLIHDGKLYKSREVFQSRAVRINRYLEEWEATGFRSPSMQHNLEWIHDLNIEYDASTFDTDPFEPQPGGMQTIFPFYVAGNDGSKGYVELPYTLPQDFTLFVLIGETNIDIWKRKLDWIVQNGGMALLNVHPDYMSFEGGKRQVDEYPAQFYEEFLQHVLTSYQGLFWHVRAKDMACYWLAEILPRQTRTAPLEMQ